MKVKLTEGFQYKGRWISSYDVIRRPVIRDRIEGVLFSEEKFGKEIPDVVAIYIISKCGRFDGEEIPVEFLLDNLSLEDARLLIRAVENFRPPQKGSKEGSQDSQSGRDSMAPDGAQN